MGSIQTGEANAAFELIVANHVEAMLAYWDRDLVCRFANAAYLKWFGKRREEMIHKMTLPELLGPQLFARNKPYIEAALQGQVQTFERDIPTPEGGIRPSLANYYPHFVDGAVAGFVVHVADVSLIKKLESELLSSNQVIGEQNKRLLNFANIVSHNLGSYSANLQSLLELYDASSSEAEKIDVIDHLRATVFSFASTVRGLGEIVDAQNNMTVASQPVNVSALIEHVRNILRPQIDATSASVRNEVGADLLIRCNRAYLESIVLNLVSNAIKYRHPDRQPDVVVSADIIDGSFQLSVRDNGLGINLEKHRKEMFGMHKTFHGNQDAKGIGLFITRYQAETMGGFIAVASEVGKGTAFTVTLPMS